MFDIQYFAKMLQKYRKEQGLTQNEFAEMLRISAQSVSSWECGKSTPDIGHLCQISEILSVSLDVLLQKDVTRPRCLIGIDGGGTKTEFVLIDEWGHKLNSLILSGSNPNTCGIQEAISIICQGVGYLRPRAMNVVGIFLGGAGLDVGNNADMVADALRAAYPDCEVGCANDIYNVIACSVRPDSCVAAISGTGCIVHSSYHGQIRRVGGLGYLFERGGSGYDIGRDALTAAMWARDGIEEVTLLTALVEEKLGGMAWEHLQDLYREDVAYIASFAPLVSQAAEQKDPAALAILQKNSQHMARMIRTALAHAPDIRNVIFGGSLFAKNDLFFHMVSEQLEPALTIERMTWPPVWGACLQCGKMCRLEKAPVYENFLRE